jgi:hypothetical protein
MKSIQATIILAAFATFGALGGCSFTPPGPEQGDRGDGGTAESDACTLKVRACMNGCAKADLGFGCKICCQRNGLSCDADGGYQFYKCLDEE